MKPVSVATKKAAEWSALIGLGVTLFCAAVVDPLLHVAVGQGIAPPDGQGLAGFVERNGWAAATGVVSALISFFVLRERVRNDERRFEEFQKTTERSLASKASAESVESIRSLISEQRSDTRDAMNRIEGTLRALFPTSHRGE